MNVTHNEEILPGLSFIASSLNKHLNSPLVLLDVSGVMHKIWGCFSCQLIIEGSCFPVLEEMRDFSNKGG